MICISWVTISANRMRSTSAAITPMTMTFLRWSAGRPAASAPTTIALSPASTRSIISTWKKAAKAAGSVMLEKSLTIDAQISAGPPKPSVVAAAAANSISNIILPIVRHSRESGIG